MIEIFEMSSYVIPTEGEEFREERNEKNNLKAFEVWLA